MMENKKILLRRTVDDPWFKPGAIFDGSSYWGMFRAFLFSCVTLYILWHIEDWRVSDLIAWINGQPIPARLKIQSPYPTSAQVLAVIIGGSSMLASLAGMVMIFIDRRRLRKSAQGQWYDRPGITKESLNDDESSQNSQNGSGSN